MTSKKRLLTQAELASLYQATDWKIVDLPLENVRRTPGIERTHDLLGVFASGDANATKNLNVPDCVVGMDVIVFERRPKRHLGEGEVNVYHYVVTRTGRIDLPYCIHGPFREQALLDHWPRCLDLTVYKK